MSMPSYMNVYIPSYQQPYLVFRVQNINHGRASTTFYSLKKEK